MISGGKGQPSFFAPSSLSSRQSVVRKQAKKLGKGSLLLGTGYWGRKRGGPLLPSNVHRGIGTFSESRPPVDRSWQMSSSFLGSKCGRHTETEGVPPRWDQGHSPRLVGCEQEQPGILITTLECAPLGGEQDPIATCQVSGPTTAEKHEPGPLPACGLPCGSSVEVGGVRSVCCSRGR